MKITDILPLLKATYTQWNEHKAPRLGAALAFYTVFSIAPLLLVVLALISMVLGPDAQRHVAAQIQGTLGPHAATAVQQMVSASKKPQAANIAGAIGVVTLLLGAAGVFGQLQDALNTIWEVKLRPGAGILAMLRDRFASFSIVVCVGFLLLVSLVVSAALAGISQFVGHVLPLPGWIFEGLDFVVSMAVITALFALIYKVLPDVKIGWSDVWIGALITSVLFAIGKWAIGQYLGHSGVSSTYGAAGSLVALLLWVYYAAQILFFGAEFTRAYADRFGSHVVPAENAVAVSEATKAKEGAPSTNGTNGRTRDGRADDRGATAEPWRLPENRVIHGEGEPVPVSKDRSTIAPGGRAATDRARIAARGVLNASPPIAADRIHAKDYEPLRETSARKKIGPVAAGTAAGLLLSLLRRR